jgi:cytochrome P450
MATSTTSYDPLDAAVQADPYPHYAALRREAPVHHVVSLDAYAVSRHADVRRVLHDHETFSSEAMAALVARPVSIGDDFETVDDVPREAISIVGLDGDDHARLRRIVNRGFTPAHIARLEERMHVIASGFVDELSANGVSELQSGFAAPFPTVVIAELLGVDSDRRADFRRWAEHAVLAVFEPTTEAQRADVAASGAQMGDWLDEVIAERAGRSGDDLVSLLLRAELDGGALTREELRVFVFTLLVAGSVTTAYLIGNAVTELAGHPELVTRARRDRQLVTALIEESLRFDAPVQIAFRTATRDVEIAGSTIPRGATVLGLLGSANRDETVFAEPDRFDVGRATGEHLSFGHGVHFCLGAALARLEARVAIDELLRRATRIELAELPERAPSIVFRGPATLPVRFA